MVTPKTNPGDYIIEATGDITVYAGQSVSLKPGFHAKQGSFFHASINDENCSCGGTLGKSRNNDNYQKSSEAKYIQTEILENEINNVNSLSIKLYPNPGKDVVNLVVEGEISNGFEYKVFSTTGVLIEENHVGSNVTQLYLKKGMYIVNVNYNGIWHSKKLIIH